MTTPPPSDPFGSPPPPGEQPGPGSQPSSGQSPSYGSPPSWDSQSGYGSQPSYGSASYGSPSYGSQPGGYGPPPQPWQSGPPAGQTRTEPKAIVALICAIASWLTIPVIPAVAALMLGSSARRDIAASGGWLTGDGLVTAAKWIAWANIVLSVLGVLLAALAFGLFAV